MTSAREIVELLWLRHALHLKGLAYLEMKSFEFAQQVAEELLDVIESGLNETAMRHYYQLIGIIELKRENFPKAIEHFENAVSLLPFPYLSGRWCI